MEHFIIVALMLYDSQAAGKCLHFMTRIQSQISLSLPALSPLSEQPRTSCLQSTCSEGFELLGNAELIVVKGDLP